MSRGVSTTALHADREKNPTRAVGGAIFQTSTFRWDAVEDGARLAAERHPSEFYTRLGNPNVAQLEALLASLEGGEAALATSSGSAAATVAMLSLVSPGDHVVASRVLYGETHALVSKLLPRFGVPCTRVEGATAEHFERAMTERTRVVLVETPSNPTLEVTDLAAVAELARARGAALVVDNTFATPANTRPLSLGAKLVFHSATKYLGGHSDVLAGALVGDRESIDRAFDHLRTLGCSLGPFDAWLTVRGLRTFALRMARHNENGLRVARFLEAHPAVAEVRYPGLASHPGHEVARRQMKGFGAMVALRLKGGDSAARRFVSALELVTAATSLGGVESLVQYPAVLSNIAPEVLAAQGLPPDLVRFSVGCEDAEDLLEDLDRALRHG